MTATMDESSRGASGPGEGRSPGPATCEGTATGLVSGAPPLGLAAPLSRVDLELARAHARALGDALRASGEELRRTRDELAAIRASNAWRAATLYHRLRDRVRTALSAPLIGRPVAPPSGAGALEASPPPLVRAPFSGHTGLTLGRRGRVSVALPVHEEVATLREAIEAVLAQTRGDLELIIVNASGSASNASVLERYADDPRVVLVEDASQTLASALDACVEMATGEFVSFTSPRHVPSPSQLELMVRHLEARPDEALVSSDYEVASDTGARDADSSSACDVDAAAISVPAPRRVQLGELESTPELLAGASFLVRRDAARILGRFPRDVPGAEHYELWLRARALFATGHVPRVLHRFYAPEPDAADGRGAWLHEALLLARRRDEERRGFLHEPRTVVRIGIDATGGVAAGADELAVLSFPSSRAADPAVASALRPDVLALCWVDQPLDALDERQLSGVDLLVVSDPAAELDLDKRFGGRAFLLGAIEDRTLLEYVARYRLFEKRRVPAPPDARPRVSAPREPLRVALQADRLDRGGLEQVVLDLARHLAGGRVRATILVHGRELGATARLLRDEGHDVIVTGGDEARLLSAVEERRIQVVNLHHSSAGVARYAALGIATVYTLHSSYAWMTEEALEARARALLPVDLFVAVSSEVERFSEVALGLNPRRVRVIPNGLDARDLEAARPAPRDALGLAPSDVVFVQVGSIYPLKLQAITVEAFRRIATSAQRARLVLVGNAVDAGYAAEVERAARQPALAGRIRCLPWSTRREVAELLQAADCFVLPSLVEGCSLALMEAAYLGLPAIVTDVGSARELVRDGENGIVLPNPFPRLSALRAGDLAALTSRYPEENTRALAAAMRRVADDAVGWRARARLAAERVRKGLDASVMAAAYTDAYVDAWRRFRKP